MIIFLYFSSKPYVLTPYPICCDPSSKPSHGDGSMRGYNIGFYAEFTEIFPNYHQKIHLLDLAQFLSNQKG